MWLIPFLAAGLADRLTVPAGAQPAGPNVIVIVSDDAGYNEFGFQGSTDFQTPRLDTLAAGGVRFTNGYVSCSVCSPMRAGLMTGRYQNRCGHEFNTGPPPNPPYVGLPTDQLTLAQALKGRGYTTGAVGKWHLGTEDVFHPLRRGFDEFYGFLGGAHSYLAEAANNPILRGTTPDPSWVGSYLTDVFGDEGAAFVENHHADENPFFLYLAFNAVHTPLHTTQEDLDQFPHLSGQPQKRAAMALAMDRAIGKVLDKLAEHDIDDDTLVFFVNDNGGPLGSGADNTPLRGGKGQSFEGGHRVPFLVKGPGLTPGVCDSPVISLDIFATALAAAGATVPAGADGVDLMPFLHGEAQGNPHDVLCWRKGGSWAVRKGDWKLLREGGKLKLFNLAENDEENEAGNLYAQRPDTVRELLEDFTVWEAQLAKPGWENKGGPPAQGDVFRYRHGLADRANWSDDEMWEEMGETVRNTTLTPADAYANAVLIFQPGNEGDYTATNDMRRSSGLPFMLNELRLAGRFAGDSDRTATIDGNALLFVSSLSGEGPKIRLDTTRRGTDATFAFDVDVDIELLADLEITGSGTREFRLNGDITEMAGSRTITKSGRSTVTLNGNYHHTGETKITGGTMLVHGAISRTEKVTVGDGATLGGTGSIITTGGAADALLIETGGHLEPGPDIGTLAVAGDVTLEPASIFGVDIGSVGSSDQLFVGGDLILQEADGEGPLLHVQGMADNSVYTLVFCTGGVSGRFDEAHSMLPSDYFLVYSAQSIQLTPVPEPGGLMLAAAALAALVACTSRRRLT